MDPNDLGAQVYRAVSGRSINTEPGNIGDAVSWFLRQAGGNVSAAARLAGVPRRSMRDYAEGKSRPKGDRGAQMLQSAKLSERRARLRPGRENRLRAAVGDGLVIEVHGTYAYDGGSDRPPIVISDYMEDDAGNRLVDAYLSGADHTELRELFADLIVDAPFYANTMGLPPGNEHGWWVSDINIST